VLLGADEVRGQDERPVVAEHERGSTMAAEVHRAADELDRIARCTLRIEALHDEIDGARTGSASGHDDAAIGCRCQGKRADRAGDGVERRAVHPESGIRRSIRVISREPDRGRFVDERIARDDDASVRPHGHARCNRELRRQRYPHHAVLAELAIQVAIGRVSEQGKVAAVSSIRDANDHDRAIRRHRDGIGYIRAAQVGHHNAGLPEAGIERAIGQIASHGNVEGSLTGIGRSGDDHAAVRLERDGICRVHATQVGDQHRPADKPRLNVRETGHGPGG
jgi:hypothetical protein